MMKKTRKQKRLESHDWMKYCHKYWSQEYIQKLYKSPLRAGRFRMRRFMATVNYIKRSNRHDALGESFVIMTNGVCYNGRTHSFRIISSYN